MTAYVIGVLIGHIIMGVASKAINESKGYDGGFAWGFWLGIIGIIVVACKASNNITAYRTHTSVGKTESTASQLERLAKLHDTGALSDAEYNEAKQKLLAKI